MRRMTSSPFAQDFKRQAEVKARRDRAIAETQARIAAAVAARKAARIAKEA
jgi:hypothetical protein